jgi:hypothetical protein
MSDPEIKMSDEQKEILSYFETHSWQKKEKQHEPHYDWELKRCNIVKVKFFCSF